MKSAELLKNYQRDGYVLIKGVFNNAEIAGLRQRIEQLPEKRGDALSIDPLRPILLDKRVLEPVKALLGDKIVYFGDSTVRCESDGGFRYFHRDSQQDFEDPSCTEYPVVRLGIYLQDHAAHSGGLKVRRGSHRHAFLGRENLKRLLFGKPYGPLNPAALRLGRAVNLDIEAGDLIIWNLRIWHTGYAVRLKMLPKFCVHPRLENYIPKALLLPDIKPRMVIFCVYGAPSANMETYLKDRAEHHSNKEFWKFSHFDDPAVVNDCAEKGVELRIDALQHSRRNPG